MDAGNLNCPMCGVSVSSESPKCLHCGTRLATVSCPSCFAMMFEGSKFCPRCGVKAERKVGPDTRLECPKCKNKTLRAVALGHTPLNECERCHGLWIEASTFETICTDRERQSVVLGGASTVFTPGKRHLEAKIQYVRCPECRELMHRVNFAKCSGVIIDVCKRHGSWFDRDELQHIVEFIRGGGLETARAKEKVELEQARRRLEAARAAQGTSWDPRDRRPSVFMEGDLVDIAGTFVGLFS